jgi:hypothetical protein
MHTGGRPRSDSDELEEIDAELRALSLRVSALQARRSSSSPQRSHRRSPQRHQRRLVYQLPQTPVHAPPVLPLFRIGDRVWVNSSRTDSSLAGALVLGTVVGLTPKRVRIRIAATQVVVLRAPTSIQHVDATVATTRTH